MGCISCPAWKRIYLCFLKLSVFGRWVCKYTGHSILQTSILTKLLIKLQWKWTFITQEPFWKGSIFYRFTVACSTCLRYSQLCPGAVRGIRDTTTGHPPLHLGKSRRVWLKSGFSCEFRVTLGSLTLTVVVCLSGMCCSAVGRQVSAALSPLPGSFLCPYPVTSC